MSTKKDYYDILGITKDASDQDIKRAYRNLAKKYHPDVSKEENAEEKFKEVQAAYDVLSDPQKKSQYDQFGHAGSNFGNGFEGFGGGGGFEGFGGFGDFSDIFSSFFGGGATRGRRTQQQERTNGEDIEISMTIDFMEAALGTTKKINIEQEVDCHTCNGTGADHPDDVETCDKCHGQGYVNVDQRTILGTIRSQQVCNKCNGTGKFIKKHCSTCRGSGRVKENKTVDVKVPAGVDNGITLKVAGYGHGGSMGHPHGDLYITFRVRPHKLFKRDRDNIILNIPITFSQAALGTEIEVPTVYGDVNLKIPAGVQSGTRLRMRDKGIKDIRSNRLGDQYVVVDIETPKNLNNEEKKLYEQLAKAEKTRKQSLWDKFKQLFK